MAKNETAQYDSLATTLEEESDSIRQMKLGDFHNRSRLKPTDDITNKLRGELQRYANNPISDYTASIDVILFLILLINIYISSLIYI